MTDDDIIRMAREAGYLVIKGESEPLGLSEAMRDFASLIQAATREECAKACEGEAVGIIDAESDGAYNMATRHCAAAIRALGAQS